MKPRPITYRAEIISPLLASLAAGECCNVVGVSGMGKSNMVQHMLHPEILQKYLASQAADLRFITFDANMLVDWSGWGFFEALSEALLTTFSADLPDLLANQFREQHRTLLITPGNYTLSFRLCTDIVCSLCAQSQLVILFDEFDALFKHLSATILRNLRGLRDRYKYRLMYVTFSREPLLELRDPDEWNDVEPFVELFSLRELGLHPLHDDDAQAEVMRFAARHKYVPSEVMQKRIVSLSGGHPALLRSLVQQLILNPSSSEFKAILLQNIPAIRLECTKVWQQLAEEEHEGLLHTLQRKTPLHHKTAALIQKGLLTKTGDFLNIFSPLFEEYLKSFITKQDEDWREPLYIDTQQRTIAYYGRDITSEIIPRDYALLEFLWTHQGQVCTLVEVARAISAGEEVRDDDDLEWMQTRIRRLKRRLSKFVPEQPVPLRVYKLGVRLGLIAK